MKLYLAGKMGDLPECNYPAFHAAAAQLRAAGYEVVSPAEQGWPPSMPWDWYLRRDIPLVCECAGVALLPDWRHSEGAKLEVSVAHGLGMPTASCSVWLALRAAVRELGGQ